MKNRITILILFVLTAVVVYPQSGWVLKRPTPTFETVTSVYKNFAVDESGRIFKTTDGKKWNLNDDGAGYLLNKVFFLENNVGWAVGNHGTVLKTVNGGANWTQQNIPAGYNAAAVQFLNSNTGYVIGYSFSSTVIFKTTDGGSNWNYLTSLSNLLAMDAFFYNEDTGWICGMYGKIYKTTNAGLNWTLQTTNNYADLYDIQFVTSTKGWAVGHNAIMYTSDGGANWTNQNTNWSYKFRGAHFLTATTGFVVGLEGVILKTTDSGTSWIPYSDNIFYFPYYELNFTSVYFESENDGTVVGERGAFYYTTDGGDSWDSRSPLTGINNVYRSSEYVWALSGNEIYSSTDNGENWSIQFENYERPFNSIHFTHEGKGWVVGQAGKVLYSTDRGQLWTEQNSGVTNSLYDVYCTTNNNPLEPPSWAYAVGSSGTILNTMNYGEIWVPQTSSVTSHLYGCYFINSSNGWIVGDNGTILKTTNGLNWNKISTGLTTRLRDVIFDSTGVVGWAVGGSEILKSTDGGLTWNTAYSQSGEDFISISFSGTEGWVSGLNGLDGLLYTSNGGGDWVPQSIPYNIYIHAIHFNQRTGFAVGRYGTIFKTTNGGITGIKDINTNEIPQSFVLAQNYPNPFNPATTIKYNIPNNSQVQITVYNSIGQKIKTLVDEELATGNYSFTFDGSNLSSGIYFYQIIADDFVDTKKMVLIK